MTNTLEKTSSQNVSHKEPSSKSSAQIAKQTSFVAFSGPIPPPDYLRQYDMLVPGISQRFLEEPLKEAEHRRALEQKIINEKIRMGRRGQIMAFLLGLLSIAVAFAAIFLGHSLAGLGTFLISAASFAGVFIYAKKHPT